MIWFYYGGFLYLVSRVRVMNNAHDFAIIPITIIIIIIITIIVSRIFANI